MQDPGCCPTGSDAATTARKSRLVAHIRDELERREAAARVAESSLLLAEVDLVEVVVDVAHTAESSRVERLQGTGPANLGGRGLLSLLGLLDQG